MWLRCGSGAQATTASWCHVVPALSAGRPLGIMVSRAGEIHRARGRRGAFGTEPGPLRRVSLADYPRRAGQLGGRFGNTSASGAAVCSRLSWVRALP